eukprot:Rmarinus@m.8621
MVKRCPAGVRSGLLDRYLVKQDVESGSKKGDSEDMLKVSDEIKTPQKVLPKCENCEEDNDMPKSASSENAEDDEQPKYRLTSNRKYLCRVKPRQIPTGILHVCRERQTCGRVPKPARHALLRHILDQHSLSSYRLASMNSDYALTPSANVYASDVQFDSVGAFLACSFSDGSIFVHEFDHYLAEECIASRETMKRTSQSPQGQGKVNVDSVVYTLRSRGRCEAVRWNPKNENQLLAINCGHPLEMFDLASQRRAPCVTFDAAAGGRQPGNNAHAFYDAAFLCNEKGLGVSAFCAACKDGTVRIFDTKSGGKDKIRLVADNVAVAGRVASMMSVDTCADGHLVCGGTTSGVLYLWDIRRPVDVLAAVKAKASFGAVSARSSLRWNLDTECVDSVRFHPTEQALVGFQQASGSVGVFDVATLKVSTCRPSVPLIPDTENAAPRQPGVSSWTTSTGAHLGVPKHRMHDSTRAFNVSTLYERTDVGTGGARSLVSQVMDPGVYGGIRTELQKAYWYVTRRRCAFASAIEGTYTCQPRGLFRIWATPASAAEVSLLSIPTSDVIAPSLVDVIRMSAPATSVSPHPTLPYTVVGLADTNVEVLKSHHWNGTSMGHSSVDES